MKESQPQPDTSRILFEVKTERHRYGDRRVFHDYLIVMSFRGRVVGVERGPSRTHKRPSQARQAARERVRLMQSHRLYVVRVTDKHIKDGDARSCHTCAIAQALWHNQERMGYPKGKWSFEVSPYGSIFSSPPRGIVLGDYWGDGKLRHIPAREMPQVVTAAKRLPARFYDESMYEWTMHWDDWAESRCMSLKDWREMHGYDDGERPSRPTPCSFVLDLDAFVPMKFQ